MSTEARALVERLRARATVAEQLADEKQQRATGRELAQAQQLRGIARGFRDAADLIESDS